MSTGKIGHTGKDFGKEVGKEGCKDKIANKCAESGCNFAYDVDIFLAKKVPGRFSLVRFAEKAGTRSVQDSRDPDSGPTEIAGVLEHCLGTHGPLRWRTGYRAAPQRYGEFLAALGSLPVEGLQEDGLLDWFRGVAGKAGSSERAQAISFLGLIQASIRKAVRRGHPLDTRLLRAVDRLGQEYGLAGRKVLYLTISCTELRDLAAHCRRTGEEGGPGDAAEA